jgi:hypothetical protein
MALEFNQEKLTTAVKAFKKTMQCNCDLDNWEPERTTGHSHVCRIHKAAYNHMYYDTPLPDTDTGEQ